MKKFKKKLIVLLSFLLMAACLAGMLDFTSMVAKTKTPKYIFLFIGDGMSTPQVQVTSDYYSKSLSFMKFPVTGSANTNSKSSGVTDSAAAATAIASGHKTKNGILNKNSKKTMNYKTIAEKLKNKKEYKIGIVTTVNLNHATPAGFYAHQSSRKNYYKIAKELIESDFDYFAGGAFKDPAGMKKNKQDIYQTAAVAGYKVIKTQSKAKKLSKKDGKAIVISEALDSSNAMPYTIDASKKVWTLKDYVNKGIEVLDNEKGFFMMVEGGKIDWSGHSNDPATLIKETKAFSDAVSAAITFYEKHPDETLILVTGDHETGGLSLSYKKTNDKERLKYLSKQKISYEKYNTDYVKKYKKNKTSFKKVLEDIKKKFGLITKEDKDAKKNSKSKWILTNEEYFLLKKAYDRTLEIGKSKKSKMSEKEYILYGTYEPLTITITRILSSKSGIEFSSYEHTGLSVPVYAKGAGADNFVGNYENTDISKKIAKLTGVK